MLALSGSIRKGAFHQQLVQVAAAGATTAGATSAGAEVPVVDLKDYPCLCSTKILNETKGRRTTPKILKQLFIEHDGLLISSPEYNSSVSALLKNTIDWGVWLRTKARCPP